MSAFFSSTWVPCLAKLADAAETLLEALMADAPADTLEGLHSARERALHQAQMLLPVMRAEAKPSHEDALVADALVARAAAATRSAIQHLEATQAELARELQQLDSTPRRVSAALLHTPSLDVRG
jgi:hypothetical protein